MHGKRSLASSAAAQWAAALLFTAGCAAALQANKRSPGVMSEGEFKPQRPPVAAYGPDKAETCPQFGTNGALAEEVGLHKAPVAPQADGRLCAMADTLLGWKTENKTELPPEAVRSFLSHYFGLPGAVRNILINDLETEDPKMVAQALADPVMNFAASSVHPLYGMMSERVKKGLTHVVLVLYDDVLQLDQPLPRKLAAGATGTLSGQLAAGYTKPRVEVVDPIGTLQKAPEQPGQAFKAELKCGDHAGKFLVQVVAEKDGTEVLVSTFPVFCNLDTPVAAKVPVAPKGPVDLAQAEKQLLDLVNSDRATAGVKPLNALPALSGIARNLAQKRAAGQGITSTDLTHSLKEAEIAAPMVLESMAQGFSIDDVYTRFSESPSDRSNTMNPDITDVGVGVVKGPVIADRQTYIAAELFVKQRPPANAAEVKSKLYAAIARKRADARASELAKDATLEKVAQEYAEAAAANGGKVDKAKESEILAPLYKESMTVNQLGGFVPDEASALDVAEQPSIVGNAKLLGVGVAVGNSPQFGKGSPFVMVLLGTRHEAPKRGAKAPRKH
jgi:uncharacterized protein YkwD